MTVTEPLWRQVHDGLRDRILSGDLKPGDRLPAEPALMAAYGVRGRGTILTAMRALMGEGLIGEGRTVLLRDPVEIRVTATETVTWIEDVARAGRVTGPPKINVKIEDGMVARYVERDLDGQPHNWARWVFPPEVAEGTRLAYDYDIPEGSIRYLEEGLEKWDHMEQTRAYEARMPSPAETADLKLPTGVPVIAEYRTGTQDGTRVFASVRILRADRTRLVP